MMTKEVYRADYDEENNEKQPNYRNIILGIAIGTATVFFITTVVLAALLGVERNKTIPVCELVQANSTITPLTTTTTTTSTTTTPYLPFVVDDSGCEVFQQIDGGNIEYSTAQEYLEKKLVYFLKQGNDANYAILRTEEVPGTFPVVRFNSSSLRCEERASPRSLFPDFNLKCIGTLLKNTFNVFYNDSLKEVYPKGANDFVLLRLKSDNPSYTEFGFRNGVPDVALCANATNAFNTTAFSLSDASESLKNRINTVINI